MAVEPKRGCGYRKVGGLYIVGGGIGVPCDRLPFALNICTCCGQGIKPTMGFTWIDVAKFFNGPHLIADPLNPDAPQALPCQDAEKQSWYCELCEHPEDMGRAGLLWIGEKFYKTPQEFVKEGIELGFSRRIRAIPHDFEIGKTWIMLAHRKTIHNMNRETGADEDTPGIFYAWKPQRIERIFKDSEQGSEKVQADEKRGITPVFVPDNDPDHQGNVHDDLENEKRAAREKEGDA